MLQWNNETSKPLLSNKLYLTNRSGNPGRNMTFCPSCGKELNEEAKFCMTCGKPAITETPPMAAQVKQAPQPHSKAGRGRNLKIIGITSIVLVSLLIAALVCPERSLLRAARPLMKALTSWL